MRKYWLNVLLVEALWAAMAYYVGGNWIGRLFAFLIMNMALVWVWRRSRTTG